MLQKRPLGTGKWASDHVQCRGPLGAWAEEVRDAGPPVEPQCGAGAPWGREPRPAPSTPVLLAVCLSRHTGEDGSHEGGCDADSPRAVKAGAAGDRAPDGGSGPEAPRMAPLQRGRRLSAGEVRHPERCSPCGAWAAAHAAHPSKEGLDHDYRAIGENSVSSSSFNIVRKMIVSEGHVYSSSSEGRVGTLPRAKQPIFSSPCGLPQAAWLLPGQRRCWRTRPEGTPTAH